MQLGKIKKLIEVSEAALDSCNSFLTFLHLPEIKIDVRV